MLALQVGSYPQIIDFISLSVIYYFFVYLFKIGVVISWGMGEGTVQSTIIPSLIQSLILLVDHPKLGGGGEGGGAVFQF
jgi:hypothetical protein